MAVLQQNLFLNNLFMGKSNNSTTFLDNMKLPIHRWFRFSAGFSAQWVSEVICKEKNKKGNNINLLDPFVGSGTALLSADECGITSYGIEAQPFIAKIARIKTNWNCNLEKFDLLIKKILKNAKNHTKIVNEYPKLIYKCFPNDALIKLEGLKKAWEKINDNSIESELVWLCITSILRSVSSVGTAQWQYVLPNKTKKRVLEVFDAFDLKSKIMTEDITLYKKHVCESKSTLIYSSSMDSEDLPSSIIDIVITSPPYANNYDYADSTRLELSFWGEIKGWGDLQEKYRKNLLRSCSQHSSKIKQSLDDILKFPDLEPIVSEITKVTKELAVERYNHPGKKHYHTMIAGYFADMAKAWKNLRRMCRENSTVCFVVGDSAPYGVYVPVDKWIGKLAIASGFKSYTFEKIRDRNIKWKNRKHRVPLHEGNLWIKG